MASAIGDIYGLTRVASSKIGCASISRSEEVTVSRGSVAGIEQDLKVAVRLNPKSRLSEKGLWEWSRNYLARVAKQLLICAKKSQDRYRQG